VTAIPLEFDVPGRQGKEPKGRYNFSLDKEVMDSLRDLSERSSLSMSRLLEVAVMRFLKDADKELAPFLSQPEPANED
jgi:hypothetical protein